MNPSATVRPGLVTRAGRAWLHFWFAPSPPEALGLARAFFFGTLFLVYASEDFAGWGAVDRVFWQPIWLFRVLGLGPASPATLSILQVLFRSSLLLAAVGLFTRPAAIVAFVLGTYLFGLPHNFGHTYHFDALLVFVFLIIACSRAGDSVSLDGRRGIRPAAGPEYTWPVRLVWVAMSLVFFAAGLSKLRHVAHSNRAIEIVVVELDGRDVLPDRFIPIELAVVDQHTGRDRSEQLRVRRDWLRGRWRERDLLPVVAIAVPLGEDELVFDDHAHADAGHVPVLEHLRHAARRERCTDCRLQR